jgi:protein-tyrosine phosphatase
MMGLIDVHAHLLPGIDDGCATLEESIACAKVLVANGYSQCYCTPHVWPNLPHNSVAGIPKFVERLQRALDDAGVPLKLMPGGEINIRPDLPRTDIEELVSYGMKGKFALVDLWAETLPDMFFETVKWMQGSGITVVLAHPERMRAMQEQPRLADELIEMGVLLQGNLQCLADPAWKMTRRVAEVYLAEGKYFMLGSDLHNLEGLEARMAGLRRAIEMVGAEGIEKLMVENPGRLCGG